MFPVRISLATLNLWGDRRWPERGPALQKFIDIYRMDIFCIQELHLETQTFLDKALEHHSRVHDDFPGWTYEGNIYWNDQIFEQTNFGAEDIGLMEQNRRLFWVRLRLRNQDTSILVSTAHFTFQERAQERETGQSPRLEFTRKTIQCLNHLAKRNEAVFFTGDLNDTIHPTLMLHDAGYTSCFVSLDMLCPPTFPCYPTARTSSDSAVKFLAQTRDWIFANEHAYPMMAQVPHCYYDDVAPSDHWPVAAIYELRSNEEQ